MPSGLKPETREQCEARLREIAARRNWQHSTPRLVDQWVAAELKLRGFR